jgi:hypothetical protein
MEVRIPVFWDVPLCSLVDYYQYFIGTCFFNSVIHSFLFDCSKWGHICYCVLCRNDQYQISRLYVVTVVFVNCFLSPNCSSIRPWADG